MACGNSEIVTLLMKAGANAQIRDFGQNLPEVGSFGAVEDDSSDEFPPAVIQKVYSLHSYESKDPLFIWLKKYHLEECFKPFVTNNLKTLENLLDKMVSNQLTDQSLINMNINKLGLRVRLLYKLEDEIVDKSQNFKKSRQKSGKPSLRTSKL